MKRATPLFLALVVAAVPAIAWAQGGIQYDKIEIKTDKLAPNLYMLSGSENVDPGHPDGAGGRIGVLVGPDGIFMVDAQYLQIGDKVLAAVRRIDSGPIRFLVNTHIHGDHTAGNATFAKLGAVLLAREELRDGLARQGGAGSDPARLPVMTYGMGDPVRFRMNGETVELIPVRAAHTGGDTMVRFVNADVIMVGDFYRNFGYPFIDTNNGGSLKGALAALELTMKIAGPNTKLVPGHGTYINRTDIVPYRDMILGVQTKVQQLIAQGKTLQEVLAAKVTSPWDAKVPGGLLPAGAAGTSADRFVSMGVLAVEGRTMKSQLLLGCVAYVVSCMPALAQTAPMCHAAAAPPQAGGAAPQARDTTVKAIPGIIAAGAKFTQVFQTVGNNVDGIVAASDGSLLASQEDNNAVLKIDKDDRASVFLAGVAVGSLSIDRQGRLFAVRRIAQNGTPAATQASAPKTAGVSMLLPDLKVWDTFDTGARMMGRPSDLSADSTGGAYFTQQCVYYVSASGTITLIGENVRTNGVLLSEDEKRLYVTNDATIVVFDLQAPGKLTNQREFTKLKDGGNGDGLAVDRAGNLYVAAGPGVQIYNRDGKYVGLIPTPQPGRPTGQAFAGADRKTLYVVVQATSDSHGRPMEGRTVYRIPTLAQGPANRSK